MPIYVKTWGPYGPDVREFVETAAEQLADERAAEAWSTPSDEIIARYGTPVLVVATFRHAVAEDGNLTQIVEEPSDRGYKLVSSGHVPAVEEEIEVRHVIQRALQNLSRASHHGLHFTQEVKQHARELYGNKELIYLSVSGYVEVWTRKRGPRA